MIFLAPLAFVLGGSAAITTATEVLGGIALFGGTALAAKALHNAGRRKGKAEGEAALTAEFQAIRARLDEMEAGH